MSEYNVGDIVRYTKGRASVAAPLAVSEYPKSDGTEALYLEGFNSLPYVDRAADFGWTVTVLEKAAPPLPTAPGYYTANLGRITGLWQLSIEGDWYYVGNEWRPVASEDTQEPDGKHVLTRLEPVPVTVQKVIDYLTSAGVILPDGPGARGLREHFGVTS